MLIVGLSPLGNALILPLEDRFPRADLDAPPAPTGFIVLGGAEDRLVGQARKAPTLNEAGERMLEAVALSRKFPDAKIAFTGGDAGIFYKSDTEAEGAAALLVSMGVAPERLILESKSRDTYENAEFLKAELERLGILDQETLGADHLGLPHAPRHGRVPQSRSRSRSLAGRLPDAGARRSHAAVRQSVGRLAPRRHRCHANGLVLLSYWLTGRTDALFPAPLRGQCGLRSGAARR